MREFTATALLCVLASGLAPRVAQAEPRARFADAPESVAPPTGRTLAAPKAEPLSVEAHAGFSRNLAANHLERGAALEARGDLALALTEYSSAINIDSSFGDAYLRLGALRERMGDPREAELVYTTAAALGNARARALLARATLRRRLARRDEALADLETSAELEPLHDTLLLLGTVYAERRAWPAALAVYRHLLTDAERSGDTQAYQELRLQVRALAVLAGDTDVTRERGAPHDWVRSSLASIAKR